ncbi:MAG: hypothetical protein IPK26_05405 [Planctomycetes bacterium]|nr:hypothetical protein [Planctomycetota bacterium]
MRLLVVSLWLGTVFAAVPAQAQSPSTTASAAEQAFRDGWWAESGQGDLAAALNRYLAAATADGPVAIRAKALLHAGAVQQRLGKAESAIATFRQLLKDHAGEADLVEQARVHLRELTAVDLRQNYDEWYERRLFSEEVQSQILGKLEQLAGELVPPTSQSAKEQAERQNRIVRVRQEVLAFGKGAVPPLRKAAVGRGTRLAEDAVELLFALGELPPTEALWRCSDWTLEASSWQTLLRRRNEAGPLPGEPIDQRTRMLAAALAGPAALLQALLEYRLIDDEVDLTAVGAALLAADAATRKSVLQVLATPTAPIMIRRCLESALIDGSPTLTATEWATVSRDPLRFELRTVGLRRVIQRIGLRDGDLFDEMLARASTASGNGRMTLVNTAIEALSHCGAQDQFPWTLGRLQQFLHLAADADVESAPVFAAVRLREDLRQLLAEALFDDPQATAAKLVPAEGEGPRQSLSAMLSPHIEDEYSTELLARRWHASLHRVLTGRWGNYDEAMRIDALRLLGQSLHGDFGGLEALRAFCQDIQSNQSEAVKVAAQAVLEAMPGN